MQEQDHKTSVVDTDIVNNDAPVVDSVNTDIPVLEAVDNHTSYSNILQIGDSNNIETMINAKTNIMIQQLGDYNSLYFNNSFSDTKTKNVINTQGNNNIIDITGSNSVSENMKVNVKGDNMTIFMRNY